MSAEAPDRKPPNWRLAEPLAERIATLRSQTRDPTRALQIGRQAGGEAARARRWREQFPFDDEGPLFTQRLAASQISEEEFLRVLADETATLCGAIAPTWSQTLVDAYLRPQTPECHAAAALPSQTDALSPFLRIAAPLIGHFAGALRRKAIEVARGDPCAPYDAQNVCELFLGELLEAYKRMLAPTMVLELNLARLAGQLAGTGPSERFHTFVSGLDDRTAALRMLARYPVLARQLVLRGENWVVSSLIFLRDLSRDWSAIRAWLDPHTDLGRLTRIQAQLGDNHGGGRAVLIATLGSGLRMVYKPRSLAVDAHFQDLLGWIGARSGGLTFKTFRVLDRGTHGWMEFVHPASCESTDGVERFYKRHGGYLALLHLLQGSDFHCENIIAAGEHPVLVDLEALFHPHIATARRSIEGIAAQGWATSVLRTGLLPMPIRFAIDGQRLDRSGLGAAQAQLSPLAVLRPVDAGTDEMHLVREHLPLRPTAHWPSVAGQPVEQIDAEAIVRGFQKVYRIIAAHKQDALDADSPLSRFRGDEVRVVLRHTGTYTRLLTESFHPDVLRDALDRDQLFDHLWADVTDSPHLGRVVAAECEDLWNGDVPLFRSHVGSREIQSSRGQRMPEFLPESTDATVRRRLLDMNEADLERQIWLIRASLATLDPKRTNLATKLWSPVEQAQAQNVRARLLAQACRIGDRLDALAWRADDEAGWMGLRHYVNDEWSVRPLGPELYEGTAGIVLFLAYLGSVTGDERYRGLAVAGANNLKNQVSAVTPAAVAIGAFTGWGGLLYLYSHLAVLWDQPDWLTEARGVVDILAPLIEGDALHDVMGGAAGCIAGLLALHAVEPSDDLVSVAIACGDQLVRSARRTTVGIGWPSALYKVALAGFSHGASGIAASLMALARLSGQRRFKDAATAALAYERSLFDSQNGNWADLRPDDAVRLAQEPMVAWCHGAAGIGLSRLGMLSDPDTQTYQREIAVAVDATLASGFGNNHCLCHGDLGNLDFLLQAAEALNHKAWNAAVQRLTRRILGEVERDGWRCGNNKPIDTPGLMTGLAGIGYGMLRLAAPHTVPPVTALRPPLITAPHACGAQRCRPHHATSG
jgi:type 2 lantibiotic biosynthesis protein LanM